MELVSEMVIGEKVWEENMACKDESRFTIVAVVALFALFKFSATDVNHIISAD